MTQKKPTLFVCFPVYNTGGLLRKFLNELGNTIPFLEKLGVAVKCIAVDDKSTDIMTCMILKHSPIPLEVIYREVNGGCCEGLSTALERVMEQCTERDFMSWLDADGEHPPMKLLGVLPVLQRKLADLALVQIVWQEDHMASYDRKLQDAMGTLEAMVIFGPDRQWRQHCPGCWVVTGEFLVDKGTPRLYRQYLNFYKSETGQLARWGEDMSFVACVHNLGGRVDDSTITVSHMVVPNRPPEKVVSQYTHAFTHLGLYERFFKKT